MSTATRSSFLNFLIGFLGAMLLAAAGMSGVAAWLAYLRPEKNVDWEALAALTFGLLLVTFLVFSVAWYRVKNS